MPNLMLLRSVLVSAVALTLSRGAVIGERSCTPESHQGWLTVYGSARGSAPVAVTLVDAAADGQAFDEVNAQLSNIGRFYFEGCPGGEPFQLHCKNCDSNPDGILVGTYSTDVDNNGEPADWVMYNSAVACGTNLGDNTHSFLFTWDGTWIHPVTYNNDGSIQPPLYAYLNPGVEIFYVESAVGPDDEYFVLGWLETTN